MIIDINMSTSNDPLTGIEAAVQLQYLTQTGSAADYGSEFLKLRSKITQETYIASLFFVGLKEEFQDGIRRLGELPDTWGKMAEKAIAVERQLNEERRQNGLCFNCGKPGHIARICSQ
jgi:hypothetical protein